MSFPPHDYGERDGVNEQKANTEEEKERDNRTDGAVRRRPFPNKNTLWTLQLTETHHHYGRHTSVTQESLLLVCNLLHFECEVGENRPVKPQDNHL